MTRDDGFDQAAYWKGRHQKYKGDPRSVGNLAASVEDNQRGENDLRTTVSTIANLIRGECSSVLDLGCGYGRVAQCWIDSGYQYTGVDVSEVALRDARTRVPSGTFICADLNRWTPTSQHDVVSALYVFVHFVDDSNWRQLLNAAILATGKYLVVADHFPGAKEQPGPHVVSRPLADYIPILGDSGLRLDWTISRQLSERHHAAHARQFVFAKRTT